MNKIIIAFEGGEGSGKDTQIALLKKKLDPDKVVFLQEPGTTEIGLRLRAELLKQKFDPPMTIEGQMYLFLAARAQLMAEQVRPALAARKVPILNRFWGSTFAYQIYGAQRRDLIPIFDEAKKLGLADLKLHTIFLDIDPAVGLARAGSRGEASTNFEAESLEYHQRVRQGYRHFVQDSVDYVIDASQPIEAVEKEVVLALRFFGAIPQ